jgi:hypothetical protein
LRISASEYRKKFSQPTSKTPSGKRGFEPAENPYEESEQRLVAKVLDAQGLDWFHVPNGGGRWSGEGGKLKAQGVKKGVPDIVVMENPKAPGFQHHPGVVIELKRIKGGTVSEEQKKWLGIFKRQGFYSGIAKGHMEVIDILLKLQMLDMKTVVRVLG